MFKHHQYLRGLCALLLSSCFITISAHGQDEEEKSPYSASVSAAYGSKAQYFREPQENYSLRGRLGYRYDELNSFSLSQALVYRNYPYEELYTGDTDLAYQYSKSLIDFPESLGLSLSPSANLELGTSEQSSARDRRYAVAGGSLSISWKALSWLTLGSSLGTDVYFYKETLSKYGEANERYAGSVGFFAGLSYKQLSFSQSVNFIQTKLYEGWEDDYRFSNSSSLSLDLPDDYSVSAKLVTSDNQLRYGRNQNFRMYDKDITRFSLTLTKKLL